jgi:hypothetical protein
VVPSPVTFPVVSSVVSLVLPLLSLVLPLLSLVLPLLSLVLPVPVLDGLSLVGVLLLVEDDAEAESSVALLVGVLLDVAVSEPAVSDPVVVVADVPAPADVIGTVRPLVVPYPVAAGVVPISPDGADGEVAEPVVASRVAASGRQSVAA